MLVAVAVAAYLLARRVVEIVMAILPKRGNADFKALLATEFLDVVQGQSLVHEDGYPGFQSVKHFPDTRRNATMLLPGKCLGGADERLALVHPRPPFLLWLPPRNTESKLACLTIIS